MTLHCFDLGLSLEDLTRDAERAVDGWDWRRGAFGHALSLPAPEDLHPASRYSYQNFPCTGLLAKCPCFRALFDRFRCDKVSFRLPTGISASVGRLASAPTAKRHAPMASGQRGSPFVTVTPARFADQISSVLRSWGLRSDRAKARSYVLGVIVAFGVLSGAASAASPDCLPLAPRNPDGNYLVPGVRGDIVYRRMEARAKSEPGALALDAYRQPGNGVHPAVIVVHGGRKAGSRVSFVGQLLETLTAAGYQWLSIDYRHDSSAGRSAAVDDVMAAVAFVRCHADALGIQPTRVALLGEDTGADLVAEAARRDPSIRALVLAGGTFTPGVAKRAVRSLVIHGSDDSSVPLSRAEAWCSTMSATPPRCDVVVVPGASHRVENWHPAQWTYKTELVEWLRDALGPGARVPASKRVTFEGRDDKAPTIGPGLVKNVVYDEATGLALDAWLPAGSGPTPAVVLVHGGGWEAGDKVTYITPLFEPLARARLAWFSIDYRLTPAVKHSSQMDDLRRAVAFIRRHAKRFRVDPASIVVVGESASGQMAALLATEDQQLAGVVSFYGVYDFMPFATPLTPRALPARLFGLTSMDSSGEAIVRQYSPINHVRREMPQILLVHGTAERLWEQGKAMARALTAVGARHELYALQDAPHGMENWEGRPEWVRYKQKVVDFIRRVTRR